MEKTCRPLMPSDSILNPLVGGYWGLYIIEDLPNGHKDDRPGTEEENKRH